MFTQELAKEWEKNLVIPNSNLTDGQRKRPQTQSQLLQTGQFCRLSIGRSAVCWTLPLLFHLPVFLALLSL